MRDCFDCKPNPVKWYYKKLIQTTDLVIDKTWRTATLDENLSSNSTALEELHLTTLGRPTHIDVTQLKFCNGHSLLRWFTYRDSIIFRCTPVRKRLVSLSTAGRSQNPWNTVLSRASRRCVATLSRGPRPSDSRPGAFSSNRHSRYTLLIRTLFN